MKEEAFSHVLDAIYDAATDVDRWPTALERIGETFGASYIGLIQRNLNTMQGRAVALGIDADGQREYFDIWTKKDVLLINTRTFRPGAVELDRDILSRAELLRSDYYNGFMKPHGMYGYMRMTLSIEDGVRSIISMSRPPKLGDFETSDAEQGRRFMPHLQRAAKVIQRLEHSGLMLAGFSELIEQSATGVVLLHQTGRVLFANRAVRAMAARADGFWLPEKKIGATNDRHHAALQTLIAGATRRIDTIDAARGGVMRLPRPSGKPDFAIAVSPLADGTAWGASGPAAFVLVTDPDAASLQSGSAIAQLFGLSAAEARVAERLMLGDSPKQAAAVLNIKMSTARWHLASLYRKTGTSRQGQLVRVLMAIPGI